MSILPLIKSEKPKQDCSNYPTSTLAFATPTGAYASCFSIRGHP